MDQNVSQGAGKLDHSLTRQYYDAYSLKYDRVRENSYHRMINKITRELILRYLPEAGNVLDLGCGTGINMDWLKGSKARIIGCDLSNGMLGHAKQKGHRVTQGTAVRLPFPDETFNLVYSFKVLPHVREIESALEEICRVLKPGGIAVLEHYNPNSLRGWIKLAIRPRLKVAGELSERDIYTRFDSPKNFFRKIRDRFDLVDSRGIVTFMPLAFVYEIPILGGLLSRLEKWASRTPLKYFGGFFITAARKK